MRLVLKNTGKSISHFNEVSVNLKYDSIASTFGFSFLADEVRDITKIGEYPMCEIYNNEEKLLTGTILTPSLTHSSSPQMDSITGYSVCGILSDVNLPINKYPLQFLNLSLKEITEKLIEPFGVAFKVSDYSELNKTFKSATLEPTETISSFLTKLSKQRGLILSSTNKGHVTYEKPNTESTPVATITESDYVSASLVCNGQQLHSEITVIRQADDGNAGQSTITNPYCKDFRSKTIIQNSGDDNDTEKTARAALGAELKNIKLSISLDSWEYKGNLIKPNNTIVFSSERLNIANPSKFFIESVSYTGNQKSQTATLSCYLPEVYNTKKVNAIF